MRRRILIFAFLVLVTFLQAQNVLQQNKTSVPIMKIELHKSIPGNPLYIVDGIPVDSNFIKRLNHASIESVDILKEPTSGILSCRSPGKVIIITTKNQNLQTIKVVDFESKEAIEGANIEFIKSGKKVMSKQTDSAGLLIDTFKIQKFDSVRISSASYLTSSFSAEKLKYNGFKVELKKNLIELSEISITAAHVFYCGRVYECKVDRLLICNLNGLKIDSNVINKTEHFSITSSVKAFPNPVNNTGVLQLNFGSSKPGLYQIRLLNTTGQLFYSFQKQISTSNDTEQIHLHERMSAGVYLLQILDDKKRLVQTTKVMVR